MENQKIKKQNLTQLLELKPENNGGPKTQIIYQLKKFDI